MLEASFELLATCTNIIACDGAHPVDKNINNACEDASISGEEPGRNRNRSLLMNPILRISGVRERMANSEIHLSFKKMAASDLGPTVDMGHTVPR